MKRATPEMVDFCEIGTVFVEACAAFEAGQRAFEARDRAAFEAARQRHAELVERHDRLAGDFRLRSHWLGESKH